MIIPLVSITNQCANHYNHLYYYHDYSDFHLDILTAKKLLSAQQTIIR